MTVVANPSEDQLTRIAIKDLVADPQNVRGANPEIDDELVASVREKGVVEPIIVRQQPGNGHFLVVAGARRVAAATKAGHRDVPAIVRTYSDQEAASVSLIENLQRADLSPMEEARGYKALMALTGGTQESIAKLVGKARPTIANALRLLDAAAPIQKALEKGTLSAAGARVVMALPEKALPLVDLAKSQSVDVLQEQARRAQRSHTALERIREQIEKAKAAGKTVTWVDGKLYLAGADVNSVTALGKPPKNIAGELRYGGYGSPDKATHDRVCECNAVAVMNNGSLESVCVSPTGWKKAQAASRRSAGRASPQKRAKVKSAEDRRKEIERDTKAAIAEAAAALDMKKLHSYHPLKTNVAPGLLKGGIAGEPARLVLFGQVVDNSGGSNKSKTWEVELWKKISTLPLKDVRERVTKWAVAAALEEIRGTTRYGMTSGGLGSNNAAVITKLVNAHYGVRAKATKAKR